MATENIRFMKFSYLGSFVEVVDLQQRLLRPLRVGARATAASLTRTKPAKSLQIASLRLSRRSFHGDRSL
jgi:hypothetical protein